MKTKLLLIAILIFSFTAKAQDITINTSMGAGYADQVYWKLDGEIEKVYEANSWDVAFLRNNNYDQAIRVNGHLGIEVFEASNNPADWATIDVADEGSWTILYNSDTAWNAGAFNQGSATYGWGEYDPVTHHVNGTVIFVLKYSSGNYVKFFIENYFGAYTFKYATWNGSAWSADQTATVSNTSNPDNIYNYYSLQNNEEVVAEPAATDWDFVFTKYWIEDYNGTGIPYNVTGALHSSLVQVAENVESSGDPLPALGDLSFSDEINTIGFDWKSFGGGTFTVHSDKRYYVKNMDEDGNTTKILRMYFTEFGGMANGNITFKYRDVSDDFAVGLDELDNAVSFAVFPNPSLDKKISLVYDVKNSNSNEILIYDLKGNLVFQQTVENNTGFANQEINLSNLQSGVYIVHFIAGTSTATKKLILK